MAAEKDKDKGKNAKAARKALENKMIAQALKVTYIASCKALDIKPQKALVNSIDVASEDGKKIVDKIAFRDHTLTGVGVRAICDVLAGYSLCQNLAFWHCNVGTTGVEAICDLLRFSAGSWSRGSKIRLLEITSDYDTPLLEPYPFLAPELPPVPDDLPDEGGPVKMAKIVDPIAEMNTLVKNAANMVARPQPADLPISNELISTCTFEGRLTPTALERLGSTLGIQGVVLRVLSLDHNGMGDVGAIALCRGLQHCASLTQLSLAYNAIGARGGAQVAKIMWPAAACKLKLLNMQGNLLGDEGLLVMGIAIGSSAEIKGINLASNRMGGPDEAAMNAVMALCDGMQSNSSLIRVDLNGNFFTPDQVREFLPTLALKEGLKQFRLNPARLSRQLVTELAAIIDKHNAKKKKGKGKKKAKKK